VSEGKYDNPPLVNRIALEGVKRIHRCNTYTVSLVCKRKAGRRCRELLGRSFVASVGNRNQYRIE
jgi:hypothetical protein